MSVAEAEGWMARAQESLSVAHELLTQRRYGFAVHHAYYAMLYAASSALATRGLGYSRHSAVIAAFGREFAKTGQLPARLHRCFIQAEELRIAADYTNIDPTTEEEARIVLTWAEEMVAAIRHFLQGGGTSPS